MYKHVHLIQGGAWLVIDVTAIPLHQYLLVAAYEEKSVIKLTTLASVAASSVSLRCDFSRLSRQMYHSSKAADEICKRTDFPAAEGAVGSVCSEIAEIMIDQLSFVHLSWSLRVVS